MRRRVLAVLGLVALAIGSGALATPASVVRWADWVGDWEGKLKWSSCTASGSATATLAFEATDGAVSIDLAPAGMALGELALIEDGHGWAGRLRDVSVHLTRPVPDTLELVVDLDSGCALRSTLKRASTGIAACDRLDGWARIEARCTKLAKPALENTARLVKQRSEWAKARGEARTKVAAQCDSRSAKVELELIDAGCAPNPDPAIGLRGSECQALRRTATRLSRCTTLPADVQSVLAREAADLSAAAQTADDASLAMLETECHDLRGRIVSVAQQVGCPP